jgi:tRNA dimethylallyltransferase
MAAGKVPLLVGGTGLYFRALERGLSKLPEADPDLRARFESEAATAGLAALHARLAAADPAAAQRIHRNDPQRIQRALEVIALTGRPLSAQQHAGRAPLPYRILKLALLPSARADLHARIAARFEAMLAGGLIEEVRALRQRPGLSESNASMRAVGYRQAWQFLDSAFDLTELRARGIHATRQLAKRQITWLRAEYDAIALDPEAAGLEIEARRRVNAFLG